MYSKRKVVGKQYSQKESDIIRENALEHGLQKSARKIVNAKLKAAGLPTRNDGALYAKMKSLSQKKTTIKATLPNEVKIAGKIVIEDGKPFIVFKLS